MLTVKITQKKSFEWFTGIKQESISIPHFYYKNTVAREMAQNKMYKWQDAVTLYTTLWKSKYHQV